MTNQFYNTPAGLPFLDVLEQQLATLNYYTEYLQTLPGVQEPDCAKLFQSKIDLSKIIEHLRSTPANPLAPQMLQYAYDAFEHKEPWLLWEYCYIGKLNPYVEKSMVGYEGCDCHEVMWLPDYEYRHIEKEPCREGSLWPDKYTQQESMSLGKEEVVFNLYEDIQCLKERIAELLGEE